MGRHGGINILHQKSWHVWRLDNRLTVERDELRHAAQEREERESEQGRVFAEKVGRLKRQALNVEEEGQGQGQGPGQGQGQGQRLGQGGSGVLPISAGTSPQQHGGKKEKEKEKERGTKTAESSFKYGQITTANLKKAEQDLESSLKLKGQRDSPTADYWAAGREGLGSGPHINLFEGAELEGKRHLAEHQKQLQYTERNNELAQKSKKALFSDFDEIAQDLPWYLRPSRSSVTEVPGSSSSTSAGLSKRWTERHGQAVLHVKVKRRRRDCAEVQDCCGDQPGLENALGGALEGVVTVTGAAVHLQGAVKVKTNTKGTKRETKESKASRKARELQTLRAERERREMEERKRASDLLSLRPAAG